MSPGKYGSLCEKLQAETQAMASAVLVVNGNAGSGFSVCYDIDELG